MHTAASCALKSTFSANTNYYLFCYIRQVFLTWYRYNWRHKISSEKIAKLLHWCVTHLLLYVFLRLNIRMKRIWQKHYCFWRKKLVLVHKKKNCLVYISGFISTFPYWCTKKKFVFAISTYFDISPPAPEIILLLVV